MSACHIVGVRDKNKTSPILPRLHRVSAVAKALDIPRSSLYRMIQRGFVAAVRIPGPSGAPIIRIPESEVCRLAAGPHDDEPQAA